SGCASTSSRGRRPACGWCRRRWVPSPSIATSSAGVATKRWRDGSSSRHREAAPVPGNRMAWWHERSLNELVVAAVLGGSALLLLEVRFEHREVLGETWRAWLPLAYAAG